MNLELPGMCPWCGQTLVGHPKQCENYVTRIGVQQFSEGADMRFPILVPGSGHDGKD